MKKTEIFVFILADILNHPQNKIPEKAIITKYSINQKTWYKYKNEMQKSFRDQDNALIFNFFEDKENEVKYIGINKSMFKYHFPDHLESAFYFEAYQKIGHHFNHQNLSRDIDKLKNYVFNLKGKGEEFQRKFYYLSNTDEKKKDCDHQAIIIKSLISNLKLKAKYKNKNYTLLPLCLTMHKGSLYLVAYKDLPIDENLRHFKLIRFNQLELQDEDFNYPKATEWNPDEYFKSAAGMFKDDLKECKLRVYAPSKFLMEEIDFFSYEVIREDSESMDIKVKFTHIQEFLGQLFIYAQDIEVLEGEEVLKAFREKAELALSRNKAA
jgi:predicted DNA-binding transcriptional regulator YafY/predicted transcriptional regulator